MKISHAAALQLLQLIAVAFFAIAQADTKPDGPLPLKLKGVKIKGALPYPQPSQTDPKPYKYVDSVYAFPGTKFYTTACGGSPNPDLETTIEKGKIHYRSNRGPSGNAWFVIYHFASAKLEVTITETYKEKILVKDIVYLSALLDNASEQHIQWYTAPARKAAAQALKAIIDHLSKFTIPNQEASCMAFLKNDAKNPYQPYSANLKSTIAYLHKVKGILLNFDA